MAFPPPALQTATPKTGSHSHTCSKAGHVYTCNYSTRCCVEQMTNGQVIIDLTCPVCINYNNGSYGT